MEFTPKKSKWVKEKDSNKSANPVSLTRYCSHRHKGINSANKTILNCLFVENVNLVIEKDIDYRHRTHCSILSVFGSPCGERENKRCLWTKTKQTIIRLVNFSLNNEIIGRNIIWPIRAGNQHSNCIGYVNIEMGNVVYRHMIICQYSVSNPNVGCIFITFSLQYNNA